MVNREVLARFALVLAPALMLGCSGDDASDAAPTTASAASIQPPTDEGSDCSDPGACTTRQLADGAGVVLGTAVTASHLDESEYRTTLVDTFNSITPENELKWASIHPGPDEWDFGPADEIIDFARDHDLAVKGHNLIWDQELIDSTPDWVLEISDPDELRQVVSEHITTIMERYGESVDRWDVVNEPLETIGSRPYDNHFRQVMGDDYIAEMFTIAHAAAPDEELWLNEAAVEYQPDKATALVSVVADLVTQGAPIDGVGIQGHLVGGTIDEVALGRLVAELEALGVEVAITELDVPVRDPADPLGVQADTYGDALRACLSNTCREVTLWGFTDRYTWIDETFGEGLEPLPFDRDYQPKPALATIRDLLSVLEAS